MYQYFIMSRGKANLNIGEISLLCFWEKLKILCFFSLNFENWIVNPILPSIGERRDYRLHMATHSLKLYDAGTVLLTYSDCPFYALHPHVRRR